MKMVSLSLAVSAALLLAAGDSQAATYVVQAKKEEFGTALKRKLEANGARVVASYPSIGVAIV